MESVKVQLAMDMLTIRPALFKTNFQAVRDEQQSIMQYQPHHKQASLF